MSRDVEFNSLQDFLTELALDAAKVEDKQVRCSVSTQPRNEGVTDVFIRAGFMVNGNRRHVTEHCGEVWTGRRAGGENNADELLGAVQATCEQLGLELRGGEFV